MSRFLTAAFAATLLAPTPALCQQQQLDQLPEEIIRTLEKMDQRMAHHERRLDKHDTRLSGIDKELYELRSRIAALEAMRSHSPGTAVTKVPPAPPPLPDDEEERGGVNSGFSKRRSTLPEASVIRPASYTRGSVDAGVYQVSGSGAYGVHYVYRVVYDPVGRKIVSWRRID